MEEGGEGGYVMRRVVESVQGEGDCERSSLGRRCVIYVVVFLCVSCFLSGAGLSQKEVIT